MKRTMMAKSRILLLGLWWPTAAWASDGPPDLARETRAIFAAKCAACHGPDLIKPKGRFGYVLDLRRVAGNPEMVVPSSPDESELWELIRRNEMPPADAPAGPLSPAQKDTIRAWIAAGAPTAANPPTSPEPLSDNPVASVPEPGPVHFLPTTLGRLHIVIIHFPIALMLAAAAAELWSVWNGRQSP